LVNNAGYGLVGTFEDLSIDDIKNQYETNVFGLMRVTQAVLPIMRRQKSGIIVNVSSGHGYLVILEVQPMLVSNLLLKV
jgi:short-subunit dehydrogenase